MEKKERRRPHWLPEWIPIWAIVGIGVIIFFLIYIFLIADQETKDATYNFLNKQLPPGMELNKLSKNDYTVLSVFSMIVALKQFYWILTIRLSMQWFPNINPYIHPMYGLINYTEWFLKQFQGLLPNILGMDMSAMCAFICLEWMIRTLESIELAEEALGPLNPLL